MIQYLDKIDQELFLFLNGLHNSFFDTIMYWVTTQETWYPFYLLILIWMFWKFKKKAIIPFIIIILSITITDQLTSGVMKPFFERLRPCHNPDIQHLVHTVSGCGGLYGFASGHAANSFSLALMLFLFFNHQNKYWSFVFIWAALVAYSRVYVGVHYPGDILVGAAIGLLVSWLLFFLYLKLPQTRRIRR
jgi:undecaprenyl-diphosphatase